MTPKDVADAVGAEEKAWQQVVLLIERLPVEQQLQFWRALNEHKRAAIYRMQAMATGGSR